MWFHRSRQFQNRNQFSRFYTDSRTSLVVPPYKGTTKQNHLRRGNEHEDHPRDVPPLQAEKTRRRMRQQHRRQQVSRRRFLRRERHRADKSRHHKRDSSHRHTGREPRGIGSAAGFTQLSLTDGLVDSDGKSSRPSGFQNRRAVRRPRRRVPSTPDQRRRRGGDTQVLDSTTPILSDCTTGIFMSDADALNTLPLTSN
jgi:hypothetical protein